MKKIALSTIKSFIRKNEGKLYIMKQSEFDSMSDCVTNIDNSKFTLCESDNKHENTKGIKGAWFVGDSRDYFTPYNENGFMGYGVYNCCGSFVLAIKQAHWLDKAIQEQKEYYGNTHSSGAFATLQEIAELNGF
jgi:hypothetical protein